MAPELIGLSAPEITRADRRAVAEVLRDRHLALGPRIDAFEREFARYVGARHAVAVNSGTSGLHLALLAAEVGPGDEVITTPFSFVASANAILMTGARPVFADILPDSLNLEPYAAAIAVTKRTRAILAVDIFGLPCDMPAFRRLARAKGLALIEDACEAIGARRGSKIVGAEGDAAVFAFYPNKQMITGEGGMVVTSNRKWANLMRSLRNQGRSIPPGRISGAAPRWLEHDRLGYNYRMDEMSAALGLSQLARIDRILERRSAVARRYDRLLASVPGVEPLPLLPGLTRSWFVYGVRLPEGVDRRRVAAAMARRGIQCGLYFPPIHLFPHYGALGYRPGDFPVTEREAARLLALPFHTRLSRAAAERVVRNLWILGHSGATVRGPSPGAGPGPPARSPRSRSRQGTPNEPPSCSWRLSGASRPWHRPRASARILGHPGAPAGLG